MHWVRDIRILLVATALLSAMIAPLSASAADGRCLVVVKGRTYLKGMCEIDVQAGGSFTVGVSDQARSKHFAYVALDAETGKARGFWNGAAAEDRAHEGLGELKRRGACWSNARARICAWKRK
ncbi:hypothetical protein CVM73_13395 [Bradyrhizobium forestalis]|uniref:Uncharacterized protein n=1 Tax=Bradyrhizobium forestalis TaxID=1419263 RepID=A0A2M8RA07_9BRAD|nr:hypothetical protein [Bradyrhizobium forestalis]PJG54653.1 hypothetical protein CVM73_13395 [Bradyrhizobium forestalis]